MKRLMFCIVTAGWVASMVATAPALELLASSEITPNSNLGACATVTFAGSQSAIVGELTVTGSSSVVAATLEMQGDSASASPQAFADVTPVFATSRTSWTGCVTGAQDPIRFGHAIFTFSASGAQGGEVVEVLECSVSNWVMRCSNA